MDTIRTYLENIFKTLPQTPRVLLVKGQLADDMETKYQELLENGANESEAIAKVIGDFGSMDELLDELEIAPGTADGVKDDTRDLLAADPVLQEITSDEATQFLAHTKKSAWFINLAVALMTIGTLLIYYWAQRVFLMPGPPEFVLFGVLIVLAAVTAGLFIHARSVLRNFSFIEKGAFTMKPALADELKSIYKAKSLSLRMTSIIAAFIYLIGSVFLLLFAMISPNWLWASSCIRALLLLIAAGAFVFIPLMMRLHAYRQLLKNGGIASTDGSTSYVIGAAATIIWPATLAIYLNWAIQLNEWRIAWVLWPLVSGLYVVFVVLYPYMSGKEVR